MSCVFAFVFAAFATPAFARECPRANPTGPTVRSQVRTLEGQLIFHDGIRQWFELKLDKPQCGQSSIQLTDIRSYGKILEPFRGCRVKSHGDLDFSSTGYYSADVYQDVQNIEAVGVCSQKPPLPDFSHAKPNQLVRSYTVEMHLTYGRRGDHPIEFQVQSGGKELRPWQAYASYMLTGGYVLYGLCGKGFVVDKIFGTPEAHPMHFDEPRTPSDMAAFDPESAAQVGETDLHLGYTCVREGR